MHNTDVISFVENVMPYNAEEGTKSFEKGVRIRFEDVQKGMILDVKLKSDSEKHTGTVTSVHSATELPKTREPLLMEKQRAHFYLGTDTIVWENDVKEIKFQGYEIPEVPETEPKAHFENDAALRKRLTQVFEQKNGRKPTEEELNKLLQQAADALASSEAA